MDPDARPTIKGIFVKSHIGALEKAHGKQALVDLGRRFGRSIDFRNNENVPVADEVKILEHIVEILAATQLPPSERALEAGRLHFRDFTTTPLWRILGPIFGKDLKVLFMHSRHIAGHVFQGVIFTAEDLGPTNVKITMTNNDYPVEHFAGFFEEWIKAAGFSPHVDAKALPRGIYEYTISWEKASS